jgi:hypothetical protein
MILFLYKMKKQKCLNFFYLYKLKFFNFIFFFLFPVSNKDNFYWAKIPLDISGTKFKWEKRIHKELNVASLKNMNSE